MPSLLDLRRTISALVAVAMSAALIAFAFIISDSFRTQTQTSARVSVGDAAVVVQDGRRANSTEGALDDSLLNRVSALDGVSSVRGAHWDMLWLDLPKQLQHAAGVQIAAQDVPALTKFTTLSSGRLPKATGEVAIDSDLAEQQGLSVGDTIRLTTKDNDNAKAVHSAPTVVGSHLRRGRTAKTPAPAPSTPPPSNSKRWEPESITTGSTSPPNLELIPVH